MSRIIDDLQQGILRFAVLEGPHYVSMVVIEARSQWEFQTASDRQVLAEAMACLNVAYAILLVSNCGVLTAFDYIIYRKRTPFSSVLTSGALWKFFLV